ncbi:Gle1 RNA export mediator [Carabus blaptoides fortunei]
MEDSLIAEFENLKISALSKSKIINTHIHDVTIGPNSKVLEDSTNITPKKIQRDLKASAKDQHKSHSSSVRLKRSPLGKMLVEIEAQRKDEVQSAVRARIEKMQTSIKQLETHSKCEWAKKQQLLIEQSKKQEESMIKSLEEYDKKALDCQHHRQVQLQRQAEERNKRNLEQQFKEKQRHQLLLLIEAIQKQQHAFRLIYQEIFVCLKDSNVANRSFDPVIFAAMSEASVKLKTLSENMEKLKEKCKAATVSTVDFEMSIALVREAGKLKESFQTIVARKLEEDREKRSAKEVKLVAPSSEAPGSAQPAPAQSTPAQSTPPSAQPVLKIPAPSFPVTSAPAPSFPVTSAPVAPAVSSSQPVQPQTAAEVKNPVTSVDTFVSRSALKMYSALQVYLETYTNNFTQLASDPQLKQFRFHCQKAVNIPLNAISAVSQQHLLDKYQRLSNLLKGLTVEAGGTNVLSSQHPQGIAYCTDLLAKKFVLQGDLLISSNPESAHCYAAMIVALWTEFPDFGKLVLAYFYQTVPYLVPIYPPQVQGQSDQDYYRSLGYTYVDGAIEKQDKFLKRMSGTVRLYAAITISSLKRNQHGQHPHGLIYAWRWIANILNLEPRVDITATCLFEFLEVTGSSMQAAYGGQFQKILTYIHDVYLPKMLKMDSGGPVCRLEVLIQKIKSTGHIEPPKGRLPEGFCCQFAKMALAAMNCVRILHNFKQKHQLILCFQVCKRNASVPPPNAEAVLLERNPTEELVVPQTVSSAFTQDMIGPPHPVSNLRPVIWFRSPSETRLQRKLRTLRQDTQHWNQQFWETHNTKFIQERKMYVQQHLVANGEKQNLTADEMSGFYKEFLDKNWHNHVTYNFHWYKRNFAILFLSMVVNVERVFQRT